MLTLCGSSISNYYNKVKLALLEKGIAFDEELVGTGRRDDAVLSASPMGKIPFLRTDHGTLCESQAILDYIEAAYPNPALIPADPWQAAKVRELITFIDLHLELVAREIYGQAFFNAPADAGLTEKVRARLERSIGAFQRLAKFSPYVAGDTFTMADCAAFASLSLVSLATKIVYGADLLSAAGIDIKGYTKLVGERPSAQRVSADRKRAQELLTAQRN